MYMYMYIGTTALPSDTVHSLGAAEHYRIRRSGDLLSLSAGKKGERSLHI